MPTQKHILALHSDAIKNMFALQTGAGKNYSRYVPPAPGQLNMYAVLTTIWWR